MGAAIELERVLGELGETPFEPLKEEQEGVAETMIEKQVDALNNTLVNFLKGNVPRPVTSSSSNMFAECQICKGGDHIATACPRLDEPRPKYAKWGMPHRTENCAMKCSFCAGLGHSEDKCWKKLKDGKVHPGSANFLQVLLNDEEATLCQIDKLHGSENLFSYTRVPRRIMPAEVATGGAVPFPGQQEGQMVTTDVEVRIQDLACEQRGWNEGDVEELIVSAVNNFSTSHAPNNIQDVQDKNADVWIPDSRQSASIRAISPKAASEEILEEEIVELLSHISLERKSVTLDCEVGKDLVKADSLLMVPLLDSACQSAQRSGSMHASSQELTSAAMMNEALVYPAEDKISAEVVEATKEIDNIPERNEEAAAIQQDRTPLEGEETEEQFHRAIDNQTAAELVGAVRDLKKTTTPVADDINIKGEFDAEVSCQRPQGRNNSILQMVSRNAYKRDPYMQEFGIYISNQLANVEARTLPPPRLKYCDTGWKKICLPSIGLWNMMRRKMVNGGIIKHWACINFSQYVTADAAHQFCNELAQMCQTS